MKKSILGLSFLCLTFWLFPQEKPMNSASPAPATTLWAFRYGTSRIAEKAVFQDGSASRDVEIAWLFYALRRQDRWILIDTGFNDPEMVKYYGVAWTDPLGLLKKAGIAPEDVAFVLLTHAHFDHLGLADRFTDARIIMSETARKDAAAHAVPPRLRDFFRYSGRIDTFNGKMSIQGWITMIEIDGHSPGSCIIRLDGDKIVFTGDEAYLPPNWTARRANGSTVDAKANLACLESLHDLASDYLILTQHDPAVVAASDGISRLR